MRSCAGGLVLSLFLGTTSVQMGCGDNMPTVTMPDAVQHNAVIVNLDGPLAELAKLRMTVSVDGPSGMKSKQLDDRPVQSSFALELPADTTGKLTLKVAGLTSTRWTLATGSGTTDVAPGQVSRMSVSLARDNRDCFDGWTCMLTYPRPDTIQAIWAWKEQPPWKEGNPANLPVWTLGNRGLFQQWDGDIWRDLPVVPGVNERQLTGMTVTSNFGRPDIWIAAQGLNYEFDGTQWQSSGGTVRKIWAAGTSDVWGVDLRSIVHWNGSAWVDMKPSGVTNEEYYGVSGTSSSDVWVVGNIILHGSVAGLKQVGPLPPNEMHDVWIDPQSKTFWSVGRDGLIIRGEPPYTSGWEIIASPLGVNYLYAISGSNNQDIWIGGDNGALSHWNGAQWLMIDSGVTTPIRAISIRATNDVWFAGEGGIVLHWNGTSIELVSDPRPDLSGIWGSASDDLWAVGKSGALFHYDGKSWKTQNSGVTYDFKSIWGSGPSDIWAVGSDQSALLAAIHWNGSTWTEAKLPPYAAGSHPVVWGTAANNVYITASQGGYFQFNGVNWSVKPTGMNPAQDIVSIDGTDSNNVWALGVNLNVARFDGSKWTNVVAPGSNGSARSIMQIKVFPGDDVWVAASGTSCCQVFRLVNLAWMPMSPTGLWQGFMAGTTSDNIWFAGYHNSLSNWNGNSFQINHYGLSFSYDYPLYLPHGIRQLFALNNKELWAVGDRGLLMRRPL